MRLCKSSRRRVFSELRLAVFTESSMARAQSMHLRNLSASSLGSKIGYDRIVR